MGLISAWTNTRTADSSNPLGPGPVEFEGRIVAASSLGAARHMDLEVCRDDGPKLLSTSIGFSVDWSPA